MSRNSIGRLDIPEGICTYLQKVFYELDGYRSLISTLLDNNIDSKTNRNELYERFMKEYQEKNAEFNLIMNEIKEEFLKQNEGFTEIKGSINLEVDFTMESAEFFIEGVCGVRNA